MKMCRGRLVAVGKCMCAGALAAAAHLQFFMRSVYALYEWMAAYVNYRGRRARVASQRLARLCLIGCLICLGVGASSAIAPVPSVVQADSSLGGSGAFLDGSMQDVAQAIETAGITGQWGQAEGFTMYGLRNLNTGACAVPGVQFVNGSCYAPDVENLTSDGWSANDVVALTTIAQSGVYPAFFNAPPGAYLKQYFYHSTGAEFFLSYGSLYAFPIGVHDVSIQICSNYAPCQTFDEFGVGISSVTYPLGDGPGEDYVSISGNGFSVQSTGLTNSAPLSATPTPGATVTSVPGGSVTHGADPFCYLYPASGAQAEMLPSCTLWDSNIAGSGRGIGADCNGSVSQGGWLCPDDSFTQLAWGDVTSCTVVQLGVECNYLGDLGNGTLANMYVSGIALSAGQEYLLEVLEHGHNASGSGLYLYGCVTGSGCSGDPATNGNFSIVAQIPAETGCDDNCRIAVQYSAPVDASSYTYDAYLETYSDWYTSPSLYCETCTDATSTPTPQPTPTGTWVPTDTSVPTNTAVATGTPVPTSTPVPVTSPTVYPTLPAVTVNITVSDTLTQTEAGSNGTSQQICPWQSSTVGDSGFLGNIADGAWGIACAIQGLPQAAENDAVSMIEPVHLSTDVQPVEDVISSKFGGDNCPNAYLAPTSFDLGWIMGFGQAEAASIDAAPTCSTTGGEFGLITSTFGISSTESCPNPTGVPHDAAHGLWIGIPGAFVQSGPGPFHGLQSSTGGGNGSADVVWDLCTGPLASYIPQIRSWSLVSLFMTVAFIRVKKYAAWFGPGGVRQDDDD